LKKAEIIETGRKVIEQEIDALKTASGRLGDDFSKAVGLIIKCKGKVIVTGIGKSGHIGKKIAASLASLGTPSFFMHSTEALHGDSGMARKEDVIIAISNSGTTSEVVSAAERCKDMGCALISMTGNPDSKLAILADAFLNIDVAHEADHLNLAPTSSTTVTLALGDALAVVVSKAKGFTSMDFGYFHSGGALGKKTAKAK